MEMILLQDVDRLGYKYDVVTVKNGFGRNYLIPRKLAVIANPTNLAKRNEIVAKIEEEMALRIDEFKATAEKLNGATLSIGAKAGTSGKIFGSVTNIQLVNAIKEQLNLDVERRAIEITEEVKNLGSYTALVNLHKEVQATLNFDVVAE